MTRLTFILVVMSTLAACSGAKPPVTEAPRAEAIGNTAVPPPRPSGQYLEVESLVYDVDQRPIDFNGRGYAISLNDTLPRFEELRVQLTERMDQDGTLGDVAFERFGDAKDPRRRVEIHIGVEVPVEIAQAVLAVFGEGTGLPVYAGAVRAYDGFGGRWRIYVGGFVEEVDQPLDDELRRSLLTPGLSNDDFYARMPDADPYDGGDGGSYD